MNVIERIAVWHKKLCDDADFNQYLTATDDASAVEGSLFADTQIAAAIMRMLASQAGDGQFGLLPLDTIMRELARLIDRPIDFERLAREAQAERMAWVKHHEGVIPPKLKLN